MVRTYACRNCEKNGVRHDGGLCYECWHWLTYGRTAEPDSLRGDGAARNIPPPHQITPNGPGDLPRDRRTPENAPQSWVDIQQTELKFRRKH